MNDFYKQPKTLLWAEAILLLVIGFYPAILILEKGSAEPLFYFLFFIYLPVGQFALTPFFRLTGVYKYYSPMLIGYMANKDQIDLHSGGSFDYLFVMRKLKIGIEIRNRILIYQLEGLLNIVSRIENGVISPTVNIIGTSYFFNERSINRLGFELEIPSIFYRINLMVNFIDLIWMYSIAKGQFAIPKIWNAKKVKITGSNLINNKALIQDLLVKMTKKTKISTLKTVDSFD